MVDGLTLAARCAALQALVAALDETPSDALCKLVDELSAIASDVATKEEALRLHEAALQEREARIDAKLELLAELKAENHRRQPDADESIDHLLTPAKTITLNVGGTLFMTARETLLRMPGSYFDAMLSSDHWLPNEKGEYFLDLDASTFKRVIKYLRSGRLDVEGLTVNQEADLREMLDYLQIQIESPAPSAPIMPLQWDPRRCSEQILLADGNMLAKHPSRGWASVVASHPVTTFAVLVHLGLHAVEAGFLPYLDETSPVPERNEATRGWFFSCRNATVYSHDEPRSNGLLDTKVPQLALLQVTWHRLQQRISFTVDGVLLPTSLHNVVSDVNLYPTVRLFSAGSNVRLIPVQEHGLVSTS
ncbi:hypothetical protein SPRG_12493 [Saprolegnia parasitica CBS 223.65]|uniref:BTB domain-containing protein n=1 Tax=Saprolegnia parasitica (strain CBS 223.65) TaxID=695850 RepID=A0A067BXE1_SAPPC|nr:hypothetical protein SPRG_12493 [Saprolegnia parasitica CBS 223.65]KDO21530.1 hypothetical protein SPRG_12493 [Saprolegnia parasitica CBS 223.65]|eukprot:XP_012207796.1 hypothetical protein SPRG_12493 [Saprolegnia parasitica CBS 223.65]